MLDVGQDIRASNDIVKAPVASPLSFKGGLKFGLGFALAMIPLMALFFAAVYLMSRPASQNASIPIERVADQLVVKLEVAVNQMIERLRQIIEATVTRIFNRADAVAASNIILATDRIRDISNETVSRIDEEAVSIVNSASGLMEQQFTRFTNTTVESWRQNTEALIARVVELLNRQAEALAVLIENALGSAFGGILGR